MLIKRQQQIIDTSLELKSEKGIQGLTIKRNPDSEKYPGYRQ